MSTWVLLFMSSMKQKTLMKEGEILEDSKITKNWFFVSKEIKLEHSPFLSANEEQFHGLFQEEERCCGSNEQAPRKVPLKLQTGRPELTATVWIDVYAWDKQTLDAAINKLDNLIKRDFCKVDFSESIVKNFSHTQVSALQRLADQLRIQLTIDPKIGRITIEGVADGIMTVSNVIHKLIREADKKEQDKRSVELLKKLVQWYFIVITAESSELREYPSDVNLLIETAYKDNKPFVTFFTNDGEKCQIDFSKMEECSVKDPSDSLTVVRKDLIQGIIA